MKSGDQLEDLYAKLGRGDTAIEADLRNLWESLPRQGEAFYNPNITFMHLDPEQAQVLARELGENWGDDIAAGTGLQVHRGQKAATATVKGKAQQQWIISEEMARGLNNWKNPAQQSGIMGVLDVFNGMFKPFVTVFWPAFLSAMRRVLSTTCGLAAWVGATFLRTRYMQASCRRAVRAALSN